MNLSLIIPSILGLLFAALTVWAFAKAGKTMKMSTTTSLAKPSLIKLKVLDFFNERAGEYTIMQVAEDIEENYGPTQYAMNTLMAEGLLKRRLVGVLYYYKAVIPKSE